MKTSKDDEIETMYQEGSKQAIELLPLAKEQGLSFEIYLPSSLATWVLENVASGVYFSPADFIFALCVEQKDLMDFPELRKELIKSVLEKSMQNDGPTFSAQEVSDHIEKAWQNMKDPAIWKKTNV